ncbi:hypothetical protein C7974DRAFT_370955 [Boeremia exigua]|uniref:uncharacterized protein n=1 Tax=Boeremia exigua TaxID=749465 RepID=UPI001E8E89FE|nr:uncharacterized protein C7974DRAFT_370955 [Boeremia exigua]KAH6643751.1 hypothetical protein C7974DRAFT_370955 [Boeremia exigua]
MAATGAPGRAGELLLRTWKTVIVTRARLVRERRRRAGPAVRPLHHRADKRNLRGRGREECGALAALVTPGAALDVAAGCAASRRRTTAGSDRGSERQRKQTRCRHAHAAPAARRLTVALAVAAARPHIAARPPMLRRSQRAEPPPGMASSKPHQATVEDYFSDDGTGHPAIEPFTPEPSPGKANVRTKRSNPDDLGTDKLPARPSTSDVKSDSGYSSLSVAGMSSADSAASAASSQRSPPVAAPSPTPTPTQKPARPPHARQPSTQSAQGSQGAPRHPLSRRESHSSRRPTTDRRTTAPPPPPAAPRRRDSRNVDECTKPGCTKCGPDAVDSRPRTSRRQSMMHTSQPADSAPDVSHAHVYDTRSQVSDPATSAPYQASSPREGRPPVYPSPQGGPVIQPSISRRLSMNNRPARPTSYHGDPNYNWSPPSMPQPHPGSPYEHGPPLSRSAWGNMPYPPQQLNPPHMPQYPGPPPAAFYQAKQMQPSREPPHLHTQGLGQPPGYGYPAQSPVVQVGRSDRNLPSARYHVNPPPSRPAQRPQQRIDYRDQEQDDLESGSESETESDEEPEYQYQRPQKGAPSRPSLRHAKTTPAPPPPEIRRPQTIIIPEPRSPRVNDRGYDSRPARRTSMSRPPLVPSIKAKSTYETPYARTIVEGPKSSRRESLHAYDRTFKEHRARQEYNEPARSKRSSRVYDDVVVGHDYERDYRDDDEEAGPVARIPRRRRDTDADSRRRTQRPVEIRQADAEEYINARRGERETLADQSYEIAKIRSRASGGPSEAESSRSRGSDNNGEIRLRIDNNAPVTLSLNGDMEGRTLQLVPIENGMNELVISGNNRGETAYRGESTRRSERSNSVRGDKRALMIPSQARRDAEEMTERSSHSSRRRRDTRGEQDEPRRLLHRTARRGERREPEYRY